MKVKHRLRIEAVVENDGEFGEGWQIGDIIKDARSGCGGYRVYVSVGSLEPKLVHTKIEVLDVTIVLNETRTE